MRVFLIFAVMIAMSATAHSQTERSYLGHWHSGFKGASTGDLYLNADDSFRFVIEISVGSGKKSSADKSGKYRIKDDQLELYYEDHPARAQIWRFKVDGDTFWLIDSSGEEKIPYKRVIHEQK